MSRILFFVYGVVAYIAFLAAFLYAIAFVGNIVVPKTIDSGAGLPTVQALIVDVVLLGLFAVQHSGMARIEFKKWWTRVVPEPIERSTYVLVSSLVLGLLYWLWQPMPAVIWDTEGTMVAIVLSGLFWLGWAIVLGGSFMINHFDLFGLRQVALNLRNRKYVPVGFKAPMLYKFVRHPLMLGFVIAFWATPRMTAGHLLFAAATLGYILIALRLEERDLVGVYGDAYRRYQRGVSMIFPWPKAGKGKAGDDSH